MLGNDTDTDGSLDAEAVNIVQQPSHGSIVELTDGSIRYAHDGSATTTDNFSYTVADDEGKTSNIATVSITVVEQPDELLTNLPIQLRGTTGTTLEANIENASTDDLMAPGDPHLSATSSAIGAGVAPLATTADIDGDPRSQPWDVGADQYTN